MLIREIVNHAAPTLAHMKAGSLFSCVCPDETALRHDLTAANIALRSFDVSAVPLRVEDGRALLYIFQKDMLNQALHHSDALALLHALGYRKVSIAGAISHLHVCLTKRGSFPHEIGLFLGYPPADVIGFIRHGGHDCLCSGYWKVYSDAGAAQQRFDELRHCQAQYSALYATGVPLEELPRIITNG